MSDGGVKRAPLETAEVITRMIGEEIGRRCPPGWAFVLVLVDHGRTGYKTYVGNLDRDDAVAMLRELANDVEKNPPGI